MIKASELRVGNVLAVSKARHGEKFITVESITDSSINVFFREYAVESLMPVPLTPEILEKCGFEKDGFGAYNIGIEMFSCTLNVLSFSGDYLYLRQGGTDKRHEDNICVLWNKDIMKVFYLHQLQNLYFALTGNELEYKP